MIEVCMLASGSSGNAVYVATENARLLVDAGISGRRLASALNQIGVDPATLDCLLVSHDHNDHVSGAGIMARRYGLPIFATVGTWQAMNGRLGPLLPHYERAMPRQGRFSHKDLVIETFPLPHDAADTVGFLFHCGGKTVALATDLGYVTPGILDRLQNANCLILEANHDEDMLLNGTYPWPLKKRILSNSGHLSNKTAAKVLTNALAPATRHIVLAHLSEHNNLPALALETVLSELECAGCRPGKNFAVHVASRHSPSCHIRLA
ncbi:MAG: MBL fold metallo-hydrolase [Dethiobacter sp.]|jgi:phosphoribosyl 1,2-cyclic phosphodiesterase|nr:MBL fold metallo-hydrolase [Dethiobacter sp.]